MRILLVTFLSSIVILVHCDADPVLKEPQEQRLEKSLLNTFPFNAGEQSGDGTEHHEHHEHHDHHEELGIEGNPGDHADNGDDSNKVAFSEDEPPNLRQLVQLSQLTRQYGVGEEEAPPPGEKKCVQKVMMVEELTWDDVVTCDHSYDKRCHTTYKTSFDTIQEEECEENFRKTCYITMVDTAVNVTQNVCKKPLVKDCEKEGEPICRKEYQSECWTKQIPHEVEDDVAECVTVQDRMCKEETQGYTTQEKCEDWPRQECNVVKKKVTKYTAMTGCHKEPTELCAPAGCGFVEGPEECHDVVKTHIQEKPEEECSLEPVRTCKHITRLVPKLVQVPECIDVPKEICTQNKVNPRKIKKPVIKNWCYTPTEESGLQNL